MFLLLLLATACSGESKWFADYSVKEFTVDPIARTCTFTVQFDEGMRYSGTQTMTVTPNYLTGVRPSGSVGDWLSGQCADFIPPIAK